MPVIRDNRYFLIVNDRETVRSNIGLVPEKDKTIDMRLKIRRR